MSADLPLRMDRHATAIFFDDVRMENTGKLLLVGMYPDILTVASMPATIELNMMVTITTPSERPFKRLVIRALYGDSLLSEETANLSEEAEEPELPAEEYGLVPVFTVRGISKIGPFEVTQPGAIRVRVETESEILPAGALHVQLISS